MDKCENYKNEFGDGFCHEEYPPRSCSCEGNRAECERSGKIRIVIKSGENEDEVKGGTGGKAAAIAEILRKEFGSFANAEKENSVKKIRQEVLEKAIHMVCGERESDYGSPEQSLALIGKFWEDYVQAACVNENGKVHISGVDASVMMVLFKCARTALGRAKDDNFVDMCGYAANAAEIQKLMEQSK